MRNFANTVNGVESQIELDYRLVRTSADFKEAVADIKAAPEVAWDIENSGGFNPHLGGKLLCFSVATRPGKAWVFPYEHPDMLVSLKAKKKIIAFLRWLLESLNPKKIAYNLSHERKWMHRFKINARCDFDGIIAAYLIDENAPMSLKQQAKFNCQAPDWDKGIDFKSGIPRLKKLWWYNAGDSDWTLRLKEVQAKKLNAVPELARLFKFLMLPASHVLSDIEYRGICIDRDRLNDRAVLTRENIWKIEKNLTKFLPKDQIIQDRKGNDCIEDEDFGKMKVNWGSTKFLGWFLYKYLELPLLELTKTGKMGTREAVLKQLRSKHKAVDLLMTLREWKGRDSKFIKGWTERAVEHPDGTLRLHPRYNITKTEKGEGTDTGRLSCQDPNLQQTPRESFIRAIITAKPGWKFGQADLSQAEMRLAAWIANAVSLLRIFKDPSRDVHYETASDITGLKREQIDKETRKKAKAVNFGFLFGMYPKKFQTYALEKYDTVVSLSEAKAFRNRYFNKYPELAEWHENTRLRVSQAGYVKSPLGRRRRLPHIHSIDQSQSRQAERQAINSPVQATASDLILFGMALVEKELSPDIFEWVGQVHDAGLFQYDPAYEDKICNTIKRIIEHLPTQKYFGVKIGVPMVVDIDVGTHWSEGVPWKQAALRKLNQYTCDKCKKTITTIDTVEGTTPMLLGCRDRCGGTMHSHWYRVEGTPTPDYEWYKPSLRSAKKMGSAMLDHVKSGGLDIRKVSA
jgi:DNA polymerase-1